MITNLKEFEQRNKDLNIEPNKVLLSDCFESEHTLYYVLCCDNRNDNISCILVSGYSISLCRHWNPLTSQELFEKLETDSNKWTFIGNSKIEFDFKKSIRFKLSNYGTKETGVSNATVI